MKLTQLSLVAILAMVPALAGGEIEYVPQQKIAVSNSTKSVSDTTVSGKGELYYYTNDNSADLFDKQNSAAAASIRMDVSHRIYNGISANFSMIGYTDFGDEVGMYKLEQGREGAIMNLANLSAVYGTTSFIAGRQLLHSPMAGSYERYLAPSAFEAYTLVNNSVTNLTLIGSYMDKFRPNNSGSKFNALDGDNYTVGAVYQDDFSAKLWYYNVDASKYKQLYTDVAYGVKGVKLEGQVVATDYEEGEDSASYGVKLSGSIQNINLSAAYAKVEDRPTGMIEVDSIYTSSRNIWASQLVSESYKLEAGTTIADISAKVSFADYDTARELDVALGYKLNDKFSFDAIYATTEYSPDATNEGALEFISTYKF